MQPRSEPLLWLQCLALGAIPLELLLIRLVLAGADPGPVPGVERFLIWSVGVLMPAVALWRRPADWGSLLLVRQPLSSRTNDQLRISAAQSGISGLIAVVITAVLLLPALWWLDDSAVLLSEFSPASGQSRLVTLLLTSPLLALIVWQMQQLVHAATLLIGSGGPATAANSAFRAEAIATERTSLGLQLLNIPALNWPVPAPPAESEISTDDTSTRDLQSSNVPVEEQASKPLKPSADERMASEQSLLGDDNTDIELQIPAEDETSEHSEDIELNDEPISQGSESEMDDDCSNDAADRDASDSIEAEAFETETDGAEAQGAGAGSDQRASRPLARAPSGRGVPKGGSRAPAPRRPGHVR